MLENGYRDGRDTFPIYHVALTLFVSSKIILRSFLSFLPTGAKKYVVSFHNQGFNILFISEWVEL